jgi:hypothetical protein
MRWRYPTVAAVNHPRRDGILLAPEREIRFSLANGDPFFTYTTCFDISSDHLFL